MTKSTHPWISCALIGGLLVAAGGCDRDREVDPPEPAIGSPAVPTATTPGRATPDVIVARVRLFESPPADLVGRQVDLEEPVRVSRVVGDAVFYVVDPEAPGAEVMVYLEEQPTPGTPTEGRYDVSPGMMVTAIEGTIERVEPQQVEGWKLLSPEETERARQQGLYIRAARLELDTTP